MRTTSLAIGAIIASTITLGLPSLVFACGGMFCSVGPVPEPVDQTSEMIFFEINDDETITATVSIAYVGPADAFAWVVPVPMSVTTIEESSMAVFEELLTSTQIITTRPAGIVCNNRNRGSACELNDAAGGPRTEDSENDGVVVLDSGTTENFEYEVIGTEGGADASVLVNWLQEHGYNVSSNMAPVMDVYDMEGMVFLAMRLQEGADVQNIRPISFTYNGTRPMIPIRLTAVAAQPLMGIQVFIKAPTPYEPANYASITVDTAALHFDAQRTNYFDWVARQADEADGALFVAEYVSEYPPDGTLRLSRYYTRLSPHTMTLDPTFQPADATLNVLAAIDLSSREPLTRCGAPIPSRIPGPCAYNYCGQDSTCYVLDGTVGCDCSDGMVAQEIAGPDGDRRITCVPEVNPYGITLEASGVGTAFDPCDALDCGAGSCVVRSGFATCACDSGAAACLEETGITCVNVPSGSTSYGPGAGVEARPTTRFAAAESLAPRWAQTPWIVALFGLGMLSTRRRRPTA